MAKVWLDAGHGGNDPGALGSGLKEKDITLAVTLKVGKELERHGVKVGYTRRNDKTVNLNSRGPLANKYGADVFVSIHTNAHNSNAQGVETYSFPNSKNGARLAKFIQDEVLKAKLYTKNRGTKTANFAVLRQTKMPAALIEMGFITNSQDAQLLKNKQSEFATAIAKGVLKYLGINYKPVKKPSNNSNSKELYKVQVGAFSNKANAEKLSDELKKKGYSNFIKKE
jgi:N-acetylmuramoyl-L-alanine amidase